MLVSEVPALREYWYPVAYSTDVGPDPISFRVFGGDYVAWRSGSDGGIHASADRCPHRAARLSQGWVRNGCLTCPYHGWRFDGSGYCVEIPQNDPALPVPPRARLDSVLAEEQYGLIWVCVGMPRAPIPRLPEADDDDYTLIHELMEVWHASAPRIIDNGLDVSHVAFVHRNTVGAVGSPRLSDMTVERVGLHVRFSATYTTRVDAAQRANTGITGEFTTRSTYGELLDPLVFRGVLHYHENDLKHVLFKTATPVDDSTTLFCQFVARNDRPDETKQRGVADVDRIVQSEDKVLLEGISPDFPLELTTELHTRADRMTVEYRRILGELVAENAAARHQMALA